jgi:hypothetical protein
LREGTCYTDSQQTNVVFVGIVDEVNRF